MNWNSSTTSKFFQFTLLLVSACLIPDSAASFPQADEPSRMEPKFLSSVRQLTFEGRRAGEGYFSADGKQLIFQSERVEGNPFFQMFVLDLETGDTTQISPGEGKTTCGWFHPSGEKVMFASTQHDPKAREKQLKELKLREEGKERRYSWDYDPEYEIYSYDLKSKKYSKLTGARGYDAEGSYSADGKSIAFASNRSGYLPSMTNEQKKIFETDKTYMMEIYIMDADGSNVRQLTDVAGYDGGPFFSPDGRRICWRRFDEKGVIAEIMTMNIDGSDQKKLTNMRAMSWAPFYHPSGRYLIFNSNNKHGFNFEFYLVDVDGKSPPVRVTENDAFDGMASFSPDGNQIYWTSTRHDAAARKGQLFRGQWNHEFALKSLGLDVNNKEESEASESGSTAASATSAGFEDKDIGRHVSFLCQKKLGGRMTGTNGERMATAYVAAYMDSLGINPDGDNGSWYQKFEFPEGAKLGIENNLATDNQNVESGSQSVYAVDRQWRPLTFSKNGSLETAPIVFVGYGITAAEEDGQAAYDSYGETDVTDKWVMMFRYTPDDVPDKRRQHLHYHSSLRKKAMMARDKGALGMIVVSGPNSNVRQQLVPLEKDFSNSSSSIGAISITDEVAASWLKHAGHDLKELQDQLDTGALVESFEIPKFRLLGSIDVQQQTGIGRNVVGRLQMSDTPSKQAVLIGAHIDHLGRGAGGSLARDEEKKMIHVGADDNASGVAAMLEVAEFLGKLKRDGKLEMKRDIIFAAWSGEELGLHGSHHFVKRRIEQLNGEVNDLVGPFEGDPHDIAALIEYYEQLLHGAKAGSISRPRFEMIKKNVPDMQVVVKLLGTVAGNSTSEKQKNRVAEILEQAKLILKNESSKDPSNEKTTAKIEIGPQPIVACLNMDMVGRMEDKVILQGLGSSNDWKRMIEKANVPVGLPIKPSNDTQLPTDASSFYKAGVPILSAFTGSHTDYHTPRDTPEKLNYPDAARIARLMGLITRQLAISDKTPEYIRLADQPAKKLKGAGRRARLGSMPNYTDKVPTGVLLDNVSPESPAEKAGIKPGDIVVELAGRKIENIDEYQYVIGSLKVGKETSIVVLRGGNRLELKITPGSRD